MRHTLLQVELGVASMNKGDCFILDCGDQVLVYMGPASRRIERLKAITAANGIRDDDHAGKAKVVVVGECVCDSPVGVCCSSTQFGHTTHHAASFIVKEGSNWSFSKKNPDFS